MKLPALIHENCPSCKPKDYNQTKARFMGQENFGEYLYQCVECAADLWVTEAWAKKHDAGKGHKPVSLKSLSFDLQNELGAMGLNIQNLEDVEVLLGHLMEEMESSSHLGIEQSNFTEHLRMIRVIWKLIYSSMSDWKHQIRELDKISEAILEHAEAQEEKENSIALSLY